MTYRQMKQELHDIPEQCLDDDVTICWIKEDGKEYFRVDSFEKIDPKEADVLHDDHYVLNVYENG